MTCCVIMIRWASMTVTGERRFEKRLGSPIGIWVSVSERFLPPINIRRERQQTESELVIASRPQMAEGKAFRGAGQAQSVGKGCVRKSSKTKLEEGKTML